ncbi:MAG: hypothetical protein ACFN26_02595 [Kingella denitrificans]
MPPFRKMMIAADYIADFVAMAGGKQPARLPEAVLTKVQAAFSCAARPCLSVCPLGQKQPASRWI